VGLDRILRILRDLGADQIYVKKLASNDNSTNQLYFGCHLTDIPFIPTGDTVASETTSKKTVPKKDDKRRIKYHAPVKMSWFDSDGQVYPAPNAQLIYYPQYPEVRFSGFLKGADIDASDWMNP